MKFFYALLRRLVKYKMKGFMRTNQPLLRRMAASRWKFRARRNIVSKAPRGKEAGRKVFFRFLSLADGATKTRFAGFDSRTRAPGRSEIQDNQFLFYVDR
jgi:hypothetical protein